MTLRPDNELVLRCARAAHEVNRAYSEALGDVSQMPWEDAPQWQKDSVIEGVRAVLFSNVGPSQSHDGWMARKLAEGWTYGPVKDVEKREHPCMLPYEQLPMSLRRKDDLFIATVRGVAGV